MKRLFLFIVTLLLFITSANAIIFDIQIPVNMTNLTSSTGVIELNGVNTTGTITYFYNNQTNGFNKGILIYRVDTNTTNINVIDNSSNMSSILNVSYYNSQFNDYYTKMQLVNDNITKTVRDSNEKFSQDFIAYYSKQYEPKVQDINNLKDQVSLKDSAIEKQQTQINQLTLNNTYLSKQNDDLNNDRLMLAGLFVVLFLALFIVIGHNAGWYEAGKEQFNIKFRDR